MMQRSNSLLILGIAATNASVSEPEHRIQLETINRGYEGRTYWVHPRAGAIPAGRARHFRADDVKAKLLTGILWDQPNASWNKR